VLIAFAAAVALLLLPLSLMPTALCVNCIVCLLFGQKVTGSSAVLQLLGSAADFG
jgi:hypothetical protein